MYTEPKLPYGLVGTSVRDIQLHYLGNGSDKVYHAYITYAFSVLYFTPLFGRRGARLQHKHQYRFAIKPGEEIRTLLSLETEIESILAPKLAKGYKFNYDFLNVGDARLPQFLQDYTVKQPGMPTGPHYGPACSMNLGYSGVELKVADVPAPKSVYTPLPVQDWLLKNHPGLTALPEWKIPLAIRV